MSPASTNPSRLARGAWSRWCALIAAAVAGAGADAVDSGGSGGWRLSEPVVLSAEGVHSCRMDAMDADRIALAYEIGERGYLATAKIVGGSVVLSAPSDITNLDAHYPSVAALSSGRVVLAYRDTRLPSRGWAVAADLRGDALVCAPPESFAPSCGAGAQVLALSGNRFAVVYHPHAVGAGSPIHRAAVRVGSVDAQGRIRFGPEARLTESMPAWTAAVALDEETLLVATYLQQSSLLDQVLAPLRGSPTVAWASRFTVAHVRGNDRIALGRSTDGVGGPLRHPSLTALDGGRFVAAFDTQAVVGSIRGGRVALETNALFPAGGYYPISASTLSADQCLLVYSLGPPTSPRTVIRHATATPQGLKLDPEHLLTPKTARLLNSLALPNGDTLLLYRTDDPGPTFLQLYRRPASAAQGTTGIVHIP